MSYKKDRGFTLIELLIVVISIGILAALAFPQFTKSKEHALGREAIANLKLIAAAERIYRMELGVYYPIPPEPEGDEVDINSYLRLSVPSESDRNWDYTVTGTASTFNVTADRSGSGSYSNCQYSIDQSQDGPVVDGGTCP